MTFGKKTSITTIEIEWLIVLLVCNYMIITIICGDPFILKYLRDVILVSGILIVSKTRALRLENCIIIYFIFLIYSLIGVFRAVTPVLGFTILRKYVFPFLVLIIITNSNIIRDRKKFWKFLVVFFAIYSFWGVFQAQILGDEFLKGLGYPTEYSYAYQQTMLYNSYYFGGLGIQRVVALLSNSNVCALILGTTLLFLVHCYVFIREIKYKNIFLIIIGIAYLLTFSRSNFLAMLIVGIFLVWPYIPHKKGLLLSTFFIFPIICIIGIAQGESGIFNKLFLWIKDTLSFTESSAAGRTGRWSMALEAVWKNPLGIGFGHVGSVADSAGITEGYYSCENSYLAISLDTGWLGLILYILFLGMFIYKIKKVETTCKKEKDELGKRLCKGALSIIIYFCIVMFFSNHIYDMEAVSLVYIYSGIALCYGKFSQDEEIMVYD